ncbi:unnamed protein product, partial [Symbiodinium necroappetens]
GDPERWLRLQAARGYVQEWLAKKEQAAEDPLSKAKGRVPWLGCYCAVCSPYIIKMANCKACLGAAAGGGHSCKVLSQMSGRFSREAKAFMVMKISHEEMTEQGAISEWRRKQMIDKEAHKELAKMETQKRKIEREQAELDASNSACSRSSFASGSPFWPEMADDLFEAKHFQQSPAKMQRLAGLGSASEEHLAIPSFERLRFGGLGDRLRFRAWGSVSRVVSGPVLWKFLTAPFKTGSPSELGACAEIRHPKASQVKW